MKHKTVKILLITLAACVLLPQATYAIKPSQTPRPTWTQEQLTKRLNKAKDIAFKQIAAREQLIGHFLDILKKRKGEIFSTDGNELTALLNELKSQFTQWRGEIQAATTVEEVKTIQRTWIQKTSVFQAFQIRFKLLIKIAIFNKSVAQIQKRVTTLESLLAKKNNSDANNDYENAQAAIAATKTEITGLTTRIAGIKTRILALTATLYNTNETQFLSNVEAIEQDINALRQTIAHQFTALKEIQEKITALENNTPPTISITKEPRNINRIQITGGPHPPGRNEK